MRCPLTIGPSVMSRMAFIAILVITSFTFGPAVQDAGAIGCDTSGTPTTTVYLPNITKTLGGPSGWVTPFIVQNVGSAATTLEVSFYRFSDGALVTCRKVTGLAPGTSFADVPNNDSDLPGDSQFAVVVRSFGSQVVSVVNEHQGSGERAEALSYVGLNSGSTTIALPYVAKAVGGWLTTFVIQNLGSATTTVTAAFTSHDGTRTATLTRTIGPGRSAVVDPTAEAGLVAGTEYAATLSSTQPIAAVVNAHNDAPSALFPMGFSYNGTAPSVGDVYLAWVGRNADGGRYSRIIVQNVGISDATPAITFRQIGGSGQAVVTAATPLRPGRVYSFTVPSASDLSCPVAGSPTCPALGEHSVVVSGGSFAVLSSASNQTSAIGLSGGSPAAARVYLPNITRTLGGAAGWTTPVILQSAGATTATLRWYRFADGALVATQFVPSLTAGASVRIDPRTVSGLADDTQYAVVVDAAAPMRAIVLELNSLGGDGAMAYEGFAAIGVVTGAPVATSMTMSPATTTLGFGDSRQFTAAVRDQSGNTMTGFELTWSVEPATLGTVNASGLFVAGSVAGTATLRAAAATFNGTAAVTVAPRTITEGGFTFAVRATATADVYTEQTITSTDAQTIATTVSADVGGVQSTYGRAFTSRPPVYVFPTTSTYTTGMQTVLGLSASEAAISGTQTSGFFRWQSGPGGTTSKIGLNWEKVTTERPVTTVRHELTHMMIQQITKETDANPVPAWVNEGSAALEEFTVSGTEYLRMRYRYTAASMVAVRGSFTVAELTSQDIWNSRAGDAAIAQYYEASQIVQLLRDDVGTAGVIRIFDAMGQGQSFDAAFLAITGKSVATFSSSVPSRLQALSQFYPYIATARDEPGGPGLSYILYGFAPSSTVTLEILGLASGFENTTKSWTVDAYGARFIYFGPSWPADTYSFTATGLTPPSSSQPNTTVTVRLTAVKAAAIAGLTLTW